MPLTLHQPPPAMPTISAPRCATRCTPPAGPAPMPTRPARSASPAPSASPEASQQPRHTPAQDTEHTPPAAAPVLSPETSPPETLPPDANPIDALSPADQDQLLHLYTSPQFTIFDIASNYKLQIDDLVAWLKRDDIRHRLDAIAEFAAQRARDTAAILQTRSIAVFKTIIETYLEDHSSTPVTPTHEARALRQRQAEFAARIAATLLRIAGALPASTRRTPSPRPPESTSGPTAAPAPQHQPNAPGETAPPPPRLTIPSLRGLTIAAPNQPTTAQGVKPQGATTVRPGTVVNTPRPSKCEGATTVRPGTVVNTPHHHHTPHLSKTKGATTVRSGTVVNTPRHPPTHGATTVPPATVVNTPHHHHTPPSTTTTRAPPLQPADDRASPPPHFKR
jgi:hypothetical protein